MMRVGEARVRINAEFGIEIEQQTLTGWVTAGKVKGRKVVGRWYVDWDALLAFLHLDDDSSTQ